MAVTRQEKEEIVSRLKELFGSAKSIVFTNFSGLTVKQATELRNICRTQQVSYVVAKKSLMKLACQECGITADPKMLDGQVAAVIGLNDEVAPAMILADYAKAHKVLKFVGGVLEGKFLSAQEVTNLSKLPTKEVLIAKVVGSIASPLSGLVNTLSGNIRGFVRVLSQIKESKS